MVGAYFLSTGDLITFRKNGIIDAADDVVGVYHDTCGNCEAVLLPSCEDNVKEKFLKYSAFLNILPERCGAQLLIGRSKITIVFEAFGMHDSGDT
ncbi:toxin-antitoxin system, toxin component, RelE domain protein [Opisthorchis viverrini]|uniref:Toxin-antitoxin system, toxin component, RelE domain protein n=1 Tax=Opisthorchis viverrini TaxID=6198 RepID=A0A1S8WHY4_OPIVI|nr:toxin-antitoxin system, toxin component, RelE domain protein [Opisthorchis viverrini]